MNFRMPYGSSLVPADDFPTVTQVLENHYLRSFFYLQPHSDITPVQCHGSVILQRVRSQYFKVVTGERFTFDVYQQGSVTPMTQSQFNTFSAGLKRALPYPFTLDERRILKQRFEQMQSAGGKTAQQVESSQKTLDESLADATYFYGPHMTRGNFYIEQALQELRLSYRDKNPDVELPVTVPMIDSDNIVHYQMDDMTFGVSLDVDRPTFFKHWQGRTIGYMTLPEFETIFKTLVPRKYRATVYRYRFMDAYQERKYIRRSRTALPSITQVLEKTRYHALLSGATVLGDIEATICVDNIVIAKYGDVFYKLDWLAQSWGAYENGAIRSITETEFKRIKESLKQNYAFEFLYQHGIKMRSHADETGMDPQQYFERAQQREKSDLEQFVDAFEREMFSDGNALRNMRDDTLSDKEAETAFHSFVASERRKYDLPTFSELLNSQADTADIPLTQCADDCVYARKNGVSFKIKLTAPITFEAFENETVRPMNKSELILLLTDVGYSDETQQVHLMNALILNAVFDAAVKQQAETALVERSMQQDILLTSERDKALLAKKTMELKGLLFPVVSTDTLLPAVYPVSPKTTCPAGMKPLPKNDIFFGRPAQLPHFRTFYETRLIETQTVLGTSQTLNNQDVLDVHIEPTLFAGPMVCEKNGRYIHQVSLDKNHPRFLTYDLISRKASVMPMARVRALLTYWLGDTKQANQLVLQLTPIYNSQKVEVSLEDWTVPSVEEVYNLQAAKTACRVKFKGAAPEECPDFFEIVPSVCGDNIVFGKMCDIFYRIKVGQEVTFERLSDGEVFLMTPTEFDRFMIGMRDKKCLSESNAPKIMRLLREVYDMKQRPVFEKLNQEQISRSTYKKITQRNVATPVDMRGEQRTYS